MTRDQITRYETCVDLRLDRLLEIVNGLMADVAPVQPSSRVAETLTERTLRYYISEGLVDRPLGKKGTASLYGYRHILQLLALKRLQADYLPMKKIREILPARSNAELLEIILAKVPGEREPMRARALAYLDELQAPQPMARMLLESRPESFEEQRVRSPHELLAACTEASETWERVVLEDGIELHIRSDRLRGMSRREVQSMVKRILAWLQRRAG